MRKGFTIVEVLIGLLFIPMIIMISASVLSLLVNHDEDEISQIDLFERQHKHLLMLANNIEFTDSSILGTYLNEPFEILFDRNRWIKKPGYEILLENVERVYREGGCLVLVLEERTICLSEP